MLPVLSHSRRDAHGVIHEVSTPFEHHIAVVLPRDASNLAAGILASIARGSEASRSG
jgi:hypothetical protein